jgi:hypothetical protein
MPERGLAKIASMQSARARPASKRRSETVHRRIGAQLLETMPHRFRTDAEDAIALTDGGHRLNKLTAASDNGTRCSLSRFVRRAGTVHKRCSKSTSHHSAPFVSLVRVAQRIVNSNARAAMVSTPRNSAMKPPISA